MPEVLPPDIHPPDSAPESTVPNGVQNLVIELEVEPFDVLPYIRASGWKGEGTLVLSLWTKDGMVVPAQPNSRARFCLSPDGAEILFEELGQALGKKKLT